MDDPFLSADGKPRVLRGVTINTNAPRLAELACMIGFETVWIDVEHGTVGFDDIERLCTTAQAAGGLATVRIPDHSRENVLRTVEAGARIVIVPMIDTPEQARQVIEFGMFPPLGRRGFNMRSRGLDYGLDRPVVSFEKANRRTFFFTQVESTEAVDNIEAICSVDGLAGVFIGPGDLSASMGKTGQFADPELIDAVRTVIKTARSAGKHAGILIAPGPLLDAALEEGADLIFTSSDITELGRAWKALFETLPSRAKR